MTEPEAKLTAILVVLVLAIFVIGVCGDYLTKEKAMEEDASVNDFVHPDTTETTKWLKVTPTTRDALLGLYFENMEECSKFITEENGVAVGESAILYLMSCYDELMKIEEEREKRVDERAKKILGLDKAWFESKIDSGPADVEGEVGAGRFKTTEELLNETKEE